MKIGMKLISFVSAAAVAASLIPSAFADGKIAYNFDALNELPEYVTGKNFVAGENLKATEDAVLAKFWAPFCRVDIGDLFTGEILPGAEYRIKCDIKIAADSAVSNGRFYIALTDSDGNIVYNFDDKEGCVQAATKAEWKNISLDYTYKSGNKPQYVSILTLDEPDGANIVDILIDNVSVNLLEEGSDQIGDATEYYDASYDLEGLSSLPGYVKSRLLKPNNTYLLDTTIGRSGNNSIKVRYWADYLSFGFCELFSEAGVKPGDKVLLSAYVKINDDTTDFDDGTMVIGVMDENIGVTGEAVLASGETVEISKNDWTKVQMEYEIPADKTPYAIYLSNKTTGVSSEKQVIVNIDDVAITNLSNVSTAVDDERLKLTDALGVTPKLFMGEFNSDKKVTRGEFAGFMLTLLNVEEKKAQYAPFTDVQATDECAFAVSLLKDKGIMSGYPDGSFRPDETISYGEAVTVLVSQLGYGFFAKNTGGYPAGYLHLAHRIKLTEKIYEDVSAPLTMNTLLNLYINALDCAVPEENIVSSDSVTFSESDTSVLEDVFNIRHEKGIIRGNEKTYLNGESELSSLDIAIDAEVYECISEERAQQIGLLMGQYVDYYFGVEGDTEDKLLYAAADSDKNEILVIDKKDFDTSDKDYIYYYKNGSRKKVKVEFGADIIYNGKSYKGTENVFNINNGSITLINANQDSYNTIIVKDIYSYVVESVDSVGEYINTKYNENRIIAGENKHDAVVEIKRGNGRLIELSQVDGGNVIDVIESKDDGGKSVVEIIVSSDTVGGIIEEAVAGDEKNSYAVIDSRTYGITKDFEYLLEKGLIKMFDIGTNVTAYLNSRKEIVAIVSGAGKLQFGYIISGIRSVETEPVFYVKLLKEDGSIEQFDFADRIRYNGTRYDYDDTILDELMSGGKMLRQLVRFSLDTNGKINYLQTVKNTTLPEEGEICKIANNILLDKGYTYRSGGYLGLNQYTIMPDAVVFRVPIMDDAKKLYTPDRYNEKGEEFFSAFDSSYFNDGYGYKFDAYSVNGVYNNMDVVVINSGNMTNSAEVIKASTPMFVITSAAKSVNEDGDEIVLLKGKLGDADKTVRIKDDRAVKSPEFAKGDVIMFSENQNGEVHAITNGTTGVLDNFLYVLDADGNNGKPKTISNYSSNTNSSYTRITRPLFTKNGYVWTAEEATVSAFEKGSGALLPDASFDTSSMTVYVYDMKNNELIEAGIGSAQFYSEVTKNGAYMLTHVKQKKASMCVIYQ